MIYPNEVRKTNCSAETFSKRRINKIITIAIVFLSFAIVFDVPSLTLPQNVYAQDISKSDAEKVDQTAKYIKNTTPSPTVSSIGGEWAVIGIKRSGISVDKAYFNNYINGCLEILSSSADKGLGNKYTDYSRLAISLNELNQDVYNLGKNNINLFDYINDYEKVVHQGINGPIFALKAKKICNDNDKEIRDKYISYITQRQNENGSFGLTPEASDTDITAMAMSALFLYIDDVPNLKSYINKAFLYLSSVQQNDGGFFEDQTDTSTNCESTAQVIIALKQMGLSENNKFFTKNNKTPYDALNDFRCSNGAYKHQKNDEFENQMSTEQALLALTQEIVQTKYTLIYDNEWFFHNKKYLTQ